ncbi:MAG: hypothetical protein KAT58_11260 [candidate division Zixibacteria bacterium]|nr:hypothetical protein [candidate division Zixibacteria bacterium]
MNHRTSEDQSMKVRAKSESKAEADYGSAIIFATCAESEEELLHTRFLAESIRAFAGRFSDAPVWVYVPKSLAGTVAGEMNRFRALRVEIKTSSTPDEARWFYFAGKVFAAGKAEAAAVATAAVLVWMDEDTIVLQEPTDFVLGSEIGFAYRPVTHNRSGSLYAEPPDPFWNRIYKKLSIDLESLFPMVTPADRQTIRAYFNAGLLVVRPQRGILRKWGESFKVLYRDSVLVDMCREDVTKRIFLHQAALVGAVLNRLAKDAMLELSDRYNYPVFFKKMFGAESEFDSIEDVITFRYDIYFRNADTNWSRQLKGTAHLISWLKERLGND